MNSQPKLQTYEDIILPLMAVVEAIGTKGQSPGTAAMGQRQAILSGRQGEIDRQRQEREDAQALRDRALRDKLTGFQIQEAEVGSLAKSDAEAKRKAMERAIPEYRAKYRAAGTPEAKAAVNEEYRDLIPAVAESIKTAEADRKELEKEQRAFNRQKELKEMEIKAGKFEKSNAAQEKLLATQQEKATLKAEQKTAAAQTANDAVSLIDDMMSHPGRKSAVGMKGLSSGFGMKSEPIPGTDAASFVAKFKGLKSLLTLDNIRKMRGMGQLSDKEGEMLQRAATTLDLNMNEKDFNSEMSRLRASLAKTAVSGNGGGLGADESGWQDLGNGIRVRKK